MLRTSIIQTSSSSDFTPNFTFIRLAWYAQWETLLRGNKCQGMPCDPRLTLLTDCREFLRSVVHTQVLIKMYILWDMMLYRLMYRYIRSRGAASIFMAADGGSKLPQNTDTLNLVFL